MHHYEAILSHLTQAEAQLNEAIKIANDNRCRGMAEDDVVRIAEVRNAVRERSSWFTKSFNGRM
jgi:hypothetical protein